MAEGKVVSLHGGPVGEREPNDVAIMVLEQMLEAARSGEVVGVVMAALHCDGAGSFRLGGMVGGYSLLGALRMAEDDLVEVLRGMD